MTKHFNRVIKSLLVASLLVGVASISASPATIKLQPEKYPDELVVLSNGRDTWSPISGFGPIIVENKTALRPGSYKVDLRSSSKTPTGDTRLVYRVKDVSAKTEFAIIASQDSEGVTLTVEGLSGDFQGVYQGSLRAEPNIIGWTLPERDREDYPRHSRYPNIFYHKKLGYWVQGRWDFDFSNASGADNYYAKEAKSVDGIDAVFFPGLTVDSGEQDSAALSNYYLENGVVYLPLPSNKGKRLPLKERFRLSVGERLWDAVPTLNQKPSPYREQMKHLLYVDLWGGFYHDRSSFTKWMQNTVGKWIGGLTILQDWQGGGFDSNLPLALSPDLPPNQRKTGTPEEFKAWMEQMKSWGLAGLRTNYQYWRDTPIQTVKRAENVDGSPKWHSQPQDVIRIINQQERYIQSLLNTTATFSDQLTSGGLSAFPYVEYSKENPESGTIRGARNALRKQSLLIKEIVGGPVLSESLNSQFLIGEYVDSGDYGIFEGYNRMFTPEYKLRRLHGLTTFYGMGLGYRYFFAPPYGGTNRQNQGNAMYAPPWGPGSDDYRAMTIAYGNAAYLDYFSAEGMHYDKALTEAMTVGLLQRYYVGEELDDIRYESDAKGKWVTLEELLLAGKNPSPYFARMKITYKNGLTVIVNRKEESLAWKLPVFGDILLPRRSYAVYSADGSVEGFSGVPGSDAAAGRIDYTKDESRNILFINPRTTAYRNLVTATIFEDGRKVYELPPRWRLRTHVAGSFEDHFTASINWVLPKTATVEHRTEGDDAFVRIKTKDTEPVRIDRAVAAVSGGRVNIRYRTNIAFEKETFASVALMRFGEANGVVREIPGRKTFSLPNTNGNWEEASFPVVFPKENTRHIVLRIAANDPEVRGVKPTIGILDVDSISVIPSK